MPIKQNSNIAVVGTGYVGLVSGACFAELGSKVICVDRDEKKIKRLKKGIIPIYEPGLSMIVKKNIREKRLFFTTDLGRAIEGSKIIFICVGTPSARSGEADLSYVKKVAEEIGKIMKAPKLIVTKSTVPVGTGKNLVAKIISRYWKGNFEIASNPEFLREGSAVFDFLNPDRVVLGVNSPQAGKALLALYKNINCLKIITTIESSELIKYASNAFLATKISFINEIANICERTKADIEEVAKGIGSDKRIGRHFLRAGLGYGGSCLPKDSRALHQLAGLNGYNFRLLRSAIEVNNGQKRRLIEKVKNLFSSQEINPVRSKLPGATAMPTAWTSNGVNPVRSKTPEASADALAHRTSNGVKNKTIAVLGLAFKGNTDDVRESPALEIVQKLHQLGAKIKAYDPQAVENAKKALLNYKVEFCNSPYQVVKNADLALIATEWEEFRNLDWRKIKRLLKKPQIIDGRNLLDPIKMRKLGFRYVGVGRNI